MKSGFPKYIAHIFISNDNSVTKVNEVSSKWWIFTKEYNFGKVKNFYQIENLGYQSWYSLIHFYKRLICFDCLRCSRKREIWNLLSVQCAYRPKSHNAQHWSLALQINRWLMIDVIVTTKAVSYKKDLSLSC